MSTKVLLFMDSLYRNIVGDEIKPRTAQIGLVKSKKEIWRNKEGRRMEYTVVSEKCRTYAEFEYAINTIIEDLKKLKVEGNEFFSKSE